jgi:hypothetical protein
MFMGIRMRSGFIVLLLAAVFSACGGGGDSAGPSAPSVPTGLAAAGLLGHINLSWNASGGGNLTGYNVYRSDDGTTFTKLNTTVVVATNYDDAIASPAGDGILYSYRVTAMGDAESGASNTVQGIHGTRLATQYNTGFTTVAGNSPYVAEGTVVVNGGNLVVDTGTKLYVLDDTTIDLEQGSGTTAGRFLVKGLLRVLASDTAHATFTAHKTSGTLADGEGFALYFDGADSYNTANGSGTLLQNTLLNNMANGSAGGGFTFISSSPKLANLNVTSNSSTGGSYLDVRSGSGPIIENCSFDKMVLSISTDARSTSLKVDHNRFTNGYYSVAFFNLSNPGVNAGQIELNDFDGTKEAYLFGMTGGTNVPMGNNYWNGGSGSPPLPTELTGSSTIHYDFSTALSSPPSAVGPTW